MQHELNGKFKVTYKLIKKSCWREIQTFQNKRMLQWQRTPNNMIPQVSLTLTLRNHKAGGWIEMKEKAKHYAFFHKICICLVLFVKFTSL